jgi:hypothetical protein
MCCIIIYIDQKKNLLEKGESSEGNKVICIHLKISMLGGKGRGRGDSRRREEGREVM